MLSEKQRESVTHNTGPALVLAGPGSGKTTVITNRALYLSKKYLKDSSRLLVITFTKAAALEMKLRFQALNAGKHSDIIFSTFHSFCFKILSHAYDLDQSNICKDNIRHNLMRELISDMTVTKRTEPEFINALLSEISFFKNSGMKPEQYEAKNIDSESFRGLLSAYSLRLSKNRLVDFDDMLIRVNEVFYARPDYLSKWIDRFDYIMVDEAQDMNMLQYDFLRLLAGEKQNVFLVGDDDQAIYSFRGATPGILMRFKEEYRDVSIYRLEENHRSKAEIVASSMSLMSVSKERFEKNVSSVRGSGAVVRITEYDGRYAEYNAIMQKVMKLYETEKSYANNAVLFRTNRGAKLLAELCVCKGIPVSFSGKGEGIFDREYIKDVLAYLRMTVSKEIRREDFLRVMNKPLRYISRDALESPIVCESDLLDFYSGKDWMLERIKELFMSLKMIGRLSSFGAVNYVRKGIDYDSVLKQRYVNDPEGYEKAGEELSYLADMGREHKKIPELLEKIEELTVQKKEQKQEDRGDHLIISTIHASKGLEYKRVFIADADEGSIPYIKAQLSEEIEAERRLLYVGMTRAKDELYILSARKPSRFIKDIVTSL